MLKQFFFAAAAVCGCFLGADTVIESNWRPDALKLNAAEIAGWQLNRLSAAKGGKGLVIVDELSEKTVFRVIGGAASTDYYFRKMVDAKPGDTLLLRVIARGKGEIAVGYYAYDAKASWFRVADGTETLKLENKPQEYKIEIPIRNGLKGQITAKIRPTVFVLAHATAYIGRVDVSLKQGAAK